jgi:type IV pilus assembly protein PilO
MFTEEVDPDDEETPIEPEADTIDEEVDSVEPIIPITAPDGLQTIIVELSIQSKDYESMLLFIEEMEKLNRIYTIETFGFTGFSEGEERVGPMEDLLNYSIQLITYYAPDINLTLDSRTSPASDEAEKINPLQDVKEAQEPQASASEDSGTEPIEDDSTGEVIVNEPATEVPAQTPVPEKQSAKSHVVKNGETLFSISMDYYGNRSGEGVIMKANNKRFNTVYVGEVLRIPSY